jgi:hypothetical protein
VLAELLLAEDDLPKVWELLEDLRIRLLEVGQGWTALEDLIVFLVVLSFLVLVSRFLFFFLVGLFGPIEDLGLVALVFSGIRVVIRRIFTRVGVLGTALENGNVPILAERDV